ncbi:MAG TPA: cation:proton antiporter [Steroidobacteraceae bacterium]|jgi:Kef-type K+ transport system membrane component KefB|nr:cation:proton antiporter [Steroidobacteraceae bacterium]
MIFLLQMFAILTTCRLFGWLVRRWLRQPQVIGEMIAGVVLGPSLLGLLAPAIQSFLFPPESKPVLYVVAQLGIGLYMFLVGLDFRSDDFKANAPSAVAVSISGIVVPFLLAIAGTPFLMSIPGLFAGGVSQFNATLFLGAAIAITAFPVLARIIQERGLNGSLIGTLSLSAAAIGDAIAWCVLAVVLASLGAGPKVAVIAIVGGIALSTVMIFFGPRLFAPLGRIAQREQTAGAPMSATVLVAALILFTLSAYIADAIGLHAVFGGFLIGTAMPRGVFAQRLRQSLEPFTVVFLLPVFFTYSGLNTQLTMVNTPLLSLVAIAVLLASIFAKFVACWAAARLSGQDSRSALGIGALMNARGLTELIILNIGLQAGIIGPALFSMLVLMAIVTTLMASPMFEWVYGRDARRRGVLPPLKGLR